MFLHVPSNFSTHFSLAVRMPSNTVYLYFYYHLLNSNKTGARAAVAIAKNKRKEMCHVSTMLV
jgi:hypothetical protein